MMNLKKTSLAFLTDPISQFDPEAETTSFIMHAAQKNGAKIFSFELDGLYLKNGKVYASGEFLKIKYIRKRFSFQTIKKQSVELKKFDALFLRKDPPFDLAYLDQLSLLELVKDQVFMVNDPTGIKIANEKIFPFHFPKFSPPTLVSKNTETIHDFIGQQKIAIIKPLNLSGGKGIIKVSAKDPSLGSFIELTTDSGQNFVMVQKFLPEVKKGDKRILILDGEVLGSFARVPAKNDFRGNLHSGAKFIKSRITQNENRIIEAYKPELKRLGLHFVGLDLIGRYVTEINVTSPMGIREVNTLNKVRIETKIANWLSQKIKV